MKTQVGYYENKLSYEIDAADLHEALSKGENLVVIDARKPQGYDVEHIPGAVNIPHRAMHEQTVKHLKKDTLYVTYCDGIGCNASTRGALNMAKLGFQVKELIGGIEWWKRDGFPTEGKKKIIDATKVECAC